ncbi:MAG: DUF1360 domain-containing protein [Solirubrobacteraceae bacterium]
MESVEQSPTEPLNYAVLNATYGSLLATLLVATRARRLEREPIELAEWLPISAATFALSKVIVDEKVVSWVRAPFVAETPDGRRPRGQGLRYAVGELLSCTRCMGAWAALGVVGLRLASPPAGRTLTAVLAASAANDFLHSAFKLLCAKADEVSDR